ncbi:MAG TPA: RNA polymerase sigma factor [Ktedonobacteraceae bacterium]|jgi:RNA polymerase sigma-70 factor (ECF subfamily)|nr:RNA polymerase sigma factor [Ktedonobacteraceae bacterium]
MQDFQALYEDNLSSIYRFVFKSLRNREEAEDLASQIFLKALRFLDSKHSAYSVRSWLFQIARTTIADYWRTYYRTPTSSLEMRLELGWEGPTEEVMLETNDLASERVRNLLQALPERYREVLSCRFLLKLSIRETAATMGVSEANVKTLQFRAIKHANNLANSIINP